MYLINWSSCFQLSGDSLLFLTRPMTLFMLSWRSSFFLSSDSSLQSITTCCGVSSSSRHWQSGDSTLLISHRNLFRLMWPFRRLSRYTSVAKEQARNDSAKAIQNQYRKHRLQKSVCTLQRVLRAHNTRYQH